MIIRLCDCPLVPWKNGLGRTREIAVQPSTAGTGDFSWRVSVAEVDRAAPFSRFPGIDRHIVLLHGAGFTMTLDGSNTHALTTPFEPFAFAGEAMVEVMLAGGPTRDFNLMVNRARAEGFVGVHLQTGELKIRADMRLLHCAAGQVDAGGETLLPGDSWLRTPEPAPTMSLDPGAVVLAIHIRLTGHSA